jgi:hypothetical protein
MEPTQAAKVCTQAADILVTALAKVMYGSGRRALAASLSAVAVWMEPNQAADILAPALAKETDPDARESLAAGLSVVAARMQPTRAVDVLVAALRDGTDASARRHLARGLSTVTLGVPSDARERSQNPTFVVGSFATPRNILSSLALLHPHFHPRPRLLPAQDLVELLKHPFCVGEARRAVLDVLEFTYKRPFRDQWEFVEFVEKNNIRNEHGQLIDLLTPPKRPEAKP